MSYNKNLVSQRYTKVYVSYRGLFGCVRFTRKMKITLLDDISYILKGNYNNSYTVLLPMKTLYSFTPHEEVIRLKVSENYSMRTL